MHRLLPLALLLLACGSSPVGPTLTDPSTSSTGGSMACVPGQQAACSCADASDGVQVCNATGNAFGACSCGAGGGTTSSAIGGGGVGGGGGGAGGSGLGGAASSTGASQLGGGGNGGGGGAGGTAPVTYCGDQPNHVPCIFAGTDHPAVCYNTKCLERCSTNEDCGGSLGDRICLTDIEGGVCDFQSCDPAHDNCGTYDAKCVDFGATVGGYGCRPN